MDGWVCVISITRGHNFNIVYNMCNLTYKYLHVLVFTPVCCLQSAGAVEYTDCFTADG